MNGRMLHIIGVAHRAQARKRNSDATEAQGLFSHVLLDTIEKVNPAFVAEEQSEEALAELDEISITKEIAEEHDIEHRFCDPNKAERRELGYQDGQSLQLAMFMNGEEDHLSREELRLKAYAIEIGRYFPIREQFWFERLNGCREEDMIFVCGDGHIESFGRLLEGNRVQCRLVQRGIGLTAEDEWFYKAVRYLKAHPELRNK
jgi:hypothetical protein